MIKIDEHLSPLVKVSQLHKRPDAFCSEYGTFKKTEQKAIIRVIDVSYQGNRKTWFVLTHS